MGARETIDEMIKQKEQEISWLGAKGKSERERFSTGAFLRGLGTPFKPDEVISVKGRFPDVAFRDARFEIKEMVDEGRRRHDEKRKDLEKLKTAKSLSDLIEPAEYIELALEDVLRKVSSMTDALCNKYPEGERNATDLLIYFNLLDVWSVEMTEGFNPLKFDGKGWRSVSVVGNGWVYVCSVTPGAPLFISRMFGKLVKRPGMWG